MKLSSLLICFETLFLLHHEMTLYYVKGSMRVLLIRVKWPEN